MIDDVDYNTVTPEQVSDLVNDLGNVLLENEKAVFGKLTESQNKIHV